MGALKSGVKAVGELLDMSRAARMQRAREMGFRPIEGTDLMVESELGRAASNISARHARAVEAYEIGRRLRDRGITSARSDEFRYEVDSIPNWVFFSDEAYDAALDAGMRGKPAPTLEVGDRFGKVPSTGRSRNWRDDFDEDGVSVYGLASRETGEIVEDTDPLSLAFIRGTGEPETRVVGTYVGGYGSDGEPLLIGARSIAPNRLRFASAAFDPAKRDSSNLLAGVGGAAVGAGLLGVPQESSAGTRRREQRQRLSRASAVRAEVDRLQTEYARMLRGDRVEAPQYPGLAAAAEWARGVQTDVPMYTNPLESTADTLDRLAYGDYRPGGYGLGQLAADAGMTALEVFDPGTWAAAAASEANQ